MLDSWTLALRAEHKSPATIASYRRGVQAFIDYCAATDRPAVLDRPAVSAFISHLLDTGNEPTTAKLRQLAVRRLSAWLLEEGEIDRDELIGMRPPKLDQKIIEPLSDEQIKKLLYACAGSDLRDLSLIHI